jgi:hypothetical protein
MFANLCGYSPDDLRALKMRDYRRASAAYIELAGVLLPHATFVTWRPDGFADVKLADGFKLDGTQVQVLTLREGDVSDQLKADAVPGSDLAKEIGLLSLLAELDLATIHAMTWRDYQRVQVALAGFPD